MGLFHFGIHHDPERQKLNLLFVVKYLQIEYQQ